MVELDAMFVCDPSSASAYLTHASAYWDIPCRAFGKVLSCECKLQCMHYVYEGANMCLPPPRLLGVCWSHVRKAVCRDTVSTNVCRGRAVPTYKRWPLLVEMVDVRAELRLPLQAERRTRLSRFASLDVDARAVLAGFSTAPA